MYFAALDTNVLVSGLMTPYGNPGLLLDAVSTGALVPVYSAAVFAEYVDVLGRPQFAERYSNAARIELLSRLLRAGVPMADVARHAGPLPDESDRPFAELAGAAGVPLVTGNARHFPRELGIEVVTAAEMVRRLGL